MAPWTHTYLSPQHERRLCCASREPAQNFTQYIDTAEGSNQYNPLTLDEWWNSDHVKQVRKNMLQGIAPPECEVCNNKLLNTDVYRSYFNRLFGHKYEDVIENTSANGSTTLKPVSFDYRFSNLCNFKCRMCGDMLSSSWESEEKKFDMWDPREKPWMVNEVKQQIDKFTDTQIRKEFYDAINEGRLEEVYWVGGEPLMWEEHWQAMKMIKEKDLGRYVYARYNTNLSRISYRGTSLVDLLSSLRDWQVCASLDGTGRIGEYVRSGLSWPVWLENFKQLKSIAGHPRQLMIDYTVTLPGLFEAKKMFDLSQQFNVRLLTKVTFTFSPDIAMSPLFLPRDILDNIINDILDYAKPKATEFQQPFIDVFENMLNRPTIEQQWPDSYQQGQVDGKRRILKLEEIREDRFTMEQILKENNNDAYEWWKKIN